jgi:enamine deaminase RidA (YjgF/YER057c/UK114 family)
MGEKLTTSRMPTRRVRSPEVWEAADTIYSTAIETTGGRTLYIAGQTGRDRDGETVPGDVRAQARLVFRNIGALLAVAGGTFADLVKTTVFVTDARYVADYRVVQSEFLTTPPYPASTLLVVAALARPEYLIEIEAVAVIHA